MPVYTKIFCSLLSNENCSVNWRKILSPLWINRIFNKICGICLKVLHRNKWTKHERSFVCGGAFLHLVGIHGITMTPLPCWLSSTTNQFSIKVPSWFLYPSEKKWTVLRPSKRKRGRPLPSPFCPFFECSMWGD